MSTAVALHPGTTPSDPPDTLAIQPWPDSVIDALGHDPRSHYVEQYWLVISSLRGCNALGALKAQG